MKDKSLRRKIAEKIDMPADIIMDCALIRMSGNYEIFIENYKGILKYTDKKISVKTYPHNIFITGNSLEIKIITDELLCITGDVLRVSFSSEGEE